MDIKELRQGMVVEYNYEAVEVLNIDSELNIAEVRRQTDSRHFTANCRELHEDPQMHTDGSSYY